MKLFHSTYEQTAPIIKLLQYSNRLLSVLATYSRQMFVQQKTE